jgi:hypothetical protein
VKKPIDATYESFVSKPEKIVKTQFTFTALENEEGEEDTGPYVPSAPPRKQVKNTSPTEEEIDAYMEACRLEKPSCANCGKMDVPLSACSRCKQVKYCSKECQKMHWPIHKPDCKPSVTQTYEVGSFPFHLEKVHTVNIGSNIIVDKVNVGINIIVSTEKEILSFEITDRCKGPFHLIAYTPQDADYMKRVDKCLEDMKETHDKRRIDEIEMQMTELLVSHQVREPIDWNAQRDSILKRSIEIQKKLKKTKEEEKELADLKPEIPKIQKVLDISFPIAGVTFIEGHCVFSTKNSIYFESDRTRIGGEAGFVDGPIEMARFHNPTDMEWLKPDLLCIVDTGNNAIRILDTSSKNVGTFFERGQYNGKPYTLNQPMSVKGMPEPGVIVVADTGNHCITIIDIQKIKDKNVTKLTIIGEPGKPGWRDGPTSLFNRPESVCVHNDSIFVADTGNHCIRRLFLKDGVYHSETIAGTPRESGYKNGKKALFSSPCKVKRMGNFILVADRDNDKVRLIGTALPCIKGLIL